MKAYVMTTGAVFGLLAPCVRVHPRQVHFGFVDRSAS